MRLQGPIELLPPVYKKKQKDGRRFADWVKRYGFPDIESFETEDHQEFISASDAAVKGQTMYATLLKEQRNAVNTILDAANGTQTEKCFFIDGCRVERASIFIIC
ncbi:unnamed protein product [Psylliodes chrysocephalus]|uniref:Uncharacterized protein n=1 Tax=Psylliodes chrysocephalus TaxID=3402493 RepID=A0A9P0D2U6_9CUCU|nr:unnamed protein product [Psylliodes chrysocephala]